MSQVSTSLIWTGCFDVPVQVLIRSRTTVSSSRWQEPLQSRVVVGETFEVADNLMTGGGLAYEARFPPFSEGVVRGRCGR